MMSPFLACVGTFSRGPAAMVASCAFSYSLLDQPPQPPTVTFTSFWLVKNSPLLVLATTVTVWLSASRMRVEAAALPDSGVKLNLTTSRCRIFLGYDQHFADVIVGRHRRIDRNRERDDAAVFRDLGQIERNLALLRGLAAGELGDRVCCLPRIGMNARAPADDCERRATCAEHKCFATGKLSHRNFLPIILFSRDSPDESRSGVNTAASAAFQQDKRAVPTATSVSASPHGVRGADPAIFPRRLGTFLRSLALECTNIERLTLARAPA